MAADLMLLDRLEGRGVAARVYGWDRAWISLGCFQSPKSLSPGCPVPWVVRPTGGRGVLHGHDITVGMAATLDWVFGGPASDAAEALRRSRSLREVYRVAVRPIVAGLRACGVAAALGEELRSGRRTARGADCFAHVSANDVVDATGRKVCGCALKLTENWVLLQASIPVAPPLVEPSTVFPDAVEVHWQALDATRFAATLEEALAGRG